MPVVMCGHTNLSFSHLLFSFGCRWTINCTNALPCPINCTGSWSNWTNCTAECAGGNQTSVFTVTTPAQHSGTLCQADNGTVRTQPCNTHPCPEDCWGHWSNWTNCSAECATGLTTSFFTVTKVNAFGGRECEAANTTVRNKTCNEQPCPVPCVGDWGPWSECDAACGGGNRTSTFVVTTAGMWGGADCVEPNNTVRIQACNQHQCPVNCQGEVCGAGPVFDLTQVACQSRPACDSTEWLCFAHH
jgi:hypothetical protein